MGQTAIVSRITYGSIQSQRHTQTMTKLNSHNTLWHVFANPFVHPEERPEFQFPVYFRSTKIQDLMANFWLKNAKSYRESL